MSDGSDREDLTDAQLLEAWRGGDDGAGEALFERYYGFVSRFFLNKVGDDYPDLVQQTFVACHVGRDRLREDGNFRAYLFGVAHNVLRVHLRTRYRGRFEDLDDVVVAQLGPGPSTLCRQGREKTLLLQGLRSLPLPQQIVLELHYWEDLSYREIAELLGENENTIRGRANRAIVALRAIIERLESSPQVLASTLDNLDDWARRCREPDTDPDDASEE